MSFSVLYYTCVLCALVNFIFSVGSFRDIKGLMSVLSISRTDRLDFAVCNISHL